MGSFKVKNNIALMAMDCIALFKAISELQREKLCQSRTVPFSWNGQMRGQFLQAKGLEMNNFVAPLSSSTQSMVGGRHL